MASQPPKPSLSRVPAPPTGWQVLVYLGPGFLWMLSATGSGELLFTPRIASLYGYALLWALLVAVTLKWFINREIGRYTVCTGATVLQGFYQAVGPWAVWLIILPQLVVAVASVAGLAGAGATALKLFTGASLPLLTLLTLALAAAVVGLGQYRHIEKTAAVLAGALFVAILAAALGVKPDWGNAATGLVPTLPANIQFAEVLPWLGFMLSGAAGMLWFSYWVQAKGYGAATAGVEKNNQPTPTQNVAECSGEDIEKLQGWTRQVTWAITLAVVGATVIAVGFLVLGAELLRPKRLMPEENQIARTLGHLLGDVWGQFGFWFMVSAMALTFISTLLSSVDGYHRMLSEGFELLRHGRLRQLSPQRLKQGLLLGVLTVLPAGTYLVAGDPVQLLKLAGVIEAIHIPLVTGLVLYLNKKALPAALQASGVGFWGTVLGGLFFGGFALVYLLQLTGVLGDK